MSSRFWLQRRGAVQEVLCPFVSLEVRRSKQFAHVLEVFARF